MGIATGCGALAILLARSLADRRAAPAAVSTVAQTTLWRSAREAKRSLVALLWCGWRGRAVALQRAVSVRGVSEHVLAWLFPAGFRGRTVDVLAGHACRVQCLASPSADQLLSGSYDETIALWRRQSGSSGGGRVAAWSCSDSWPAHEDCVTCIAVITPSVVASGCQSGSVRLWRFAERSGSKRCGMLHARTGGSITALVAVSASTLICGLDDGIVRMWRLRGTAGGGAIDGALQCSVNAHEDAVRCLALLPTHTAERSILASGSHDMTVKVWRCSTSGDAMHCVQTLRGHSKWVSAVVALRPLRDDDGAGLPPTAAVHSPRRATLASASWDDTIRVWDALAGVCLRVLHGHAADVNCLALLRTGAVSAESPSVLLASGSDDCTVRVWNIALDGDCVDRIVLAGHTDFVTTIAAMSDGGLASASQDTSIRVWR